MLKRTYPATRCYFYFEIYFTLVLTYFVELELLFHMQQKKCKFTVKNGDTQAKNDDDPLFDKNGIKIH